MRYRNSKHEMVFTRILFISMLLLIFASNITHAGTVEDESITRAITRLLERDKIATSERIDVFTTQGTVTMTAQADGLQQPWLGLLHIINPLHHR